MTSCTGWSGFTAVVDVSETKVAIVGKDSVVVLGWVKFAGLRLKGGELAEGIDDAPEIDVEVDLPACDMYLVLADVTALIMEFALCLASWA